MPNQLVGPGGSGASSADSTACGKPRPPEGKQAGSNDDPSPPTFRGVEIVDPATRASQPEAQLSLRSELRIHLAGAASFIRCIRTSFPNPVLFIDHVALPELKATAIEVPGSDELILRYRLAGGGPGTAGVKELLLRSWQNRSDSWPVSVGVGLTAAHEAVSTPAGGMQLALGRGGPRLGQFLLLVSCIVLYWAYAYSHLLRDRSPESTGSLEARSRSLARTFMFCWLLTTSAAIAIVCLNTGAVPAIDGGMPLLLLASGVTLGSSALVDFVKKTAFGDSKGLVDDLVTEGDGLALHRLQAVAVNVLLLVLVWIELIERASIVGLDLKWSALLGISSGVYLYGKYTESPPVVLPTA